MDSRPSAITISAGSQEFPGDGDFVGSNSPQAATITYYLKERHVFGDMKLDIDNAEGKLMATLPAGKRKGLNRVQWFMRQKPPKVPPSPNLAGPALTGPMVPEGVYTVKLIKDKDTFTGQVRVVPDPASPHSAADRALQAQTLRKLYDMQERLAFINEVVMDASNQARERARKMDKSEALAKDLDTFATRLDDLHKTLVAT